MTILRAELALAEALAHRELGDRSRALAELGAVAEERAETMLYCRILATIELAAAHLDAGDLATAWDVFDQAKGLVEAESFGCDGRGWLARLGTLLAVTDGDLVAALHWTEELVDPFWRGIGKARIHLATGNRSEAAGSLATVVPRCIRHWVVLELLLARCVTDREEAEKHAATAVEMAVGNGLLQTIASEGIESVELVEHVAWRAPDEWLARLRRLADARTSSRTGRCQPVEPLTERERDVLRFLPSRLTIREIADELYVSVNTLKFHLKVIYRKLGVNSRAEAAEASRRMTSVRR
jgi:LuxR family maltose regulon positive regulatory protein